MDVVLQDSAKIGQIRAGQLALQLSKKDVVSSSDLQAMLSLLSRACPLIRAFRAA